jgi:hypothetical protein
LLGGEDEEGGGEEEDEADDAEGDACPYRRETRKASPAWRVRSGGYQRSKGTRTHSPQQDETRRCRKKRGARGVVVKEKKETRVGKVTHHNMQLVIGFIRKIREKHICPSFPNAHDDAIHAGRDQPRSIVVHV